MAANETDLILNLPFDEASGSAKAYDYARDRHDATVSGADFIAGRQGNCIHFDGEGSATIEDSFLNLNGDFTLLAWVKPATFADGVTGKNRLGFFFNTAALEGSRAVWLDVLTDTWGYYTIRKKGTVIDIFADTQHRETVNMPGALTGLAIIQDIYSTGLAYADVDEVKIYGVPLTDEDIADTLNDVRQLDYYLNGVNFKDYDIRVSSSEGVLDLPKLKTPLSVDWPDYHGEIVDLDDKRVEARVIKLNCWMRAKGKIDFATKVNAFQQQFMRNGTARLMISIHPTKPLVYEVYNAEGVSYDKRWHDDKMIGTFTLTLREPDPVKRVLRHQRSSQATAKVTVGFKSDKMVTIYWGDGAADYDLYGDYTGANAVEHTYATDGTYYPIVAGIIDKITNFSTNAIIVWDTI